jgi:hypothetical protein
MDSMDPKLVVVIGDRGVRLIRLVSKDAQEEEKCLGLYQKIRKELRKIDKVLKYGN